MSKPTVVLVNVKNASLVILMVLAVTASLYLARAFFTPLVLGVLISYSLYPVVSFLHRTLHLARSVGAAMIVGLLIMASAYTVLALQQQLVELIEKIPAVVKQVQVAREVADDADSSLLAKIRVAASEIEKAADEAAAAGNRVLAKQNAQAPGREGVDTATPADRNGDANGVAPQPGGTASKPLRSSERSSETPVRVVIDRGPGQYFNYLVDGSMGVVVLLGQALIVMLFVFFTLSSGDLYKVKVVRVSGDTLSEKKIAVQVLERLNTQLRLFLFVTLIGAIFVAVVTGCAFWWLGMEQALLWGVIAGVASIVPYVGPAFVFFASAVTAFLQFGTVAQALLIAGASLLITSIQGNLLTPWMTSRAASMNAVAVFTSLLFWGWLWGPVGLIVATPVLMAIKTVCDHIENLQGIGEFISDERNGSLGNRKLA